MPEPELAPSASDVAPTAPLPTLSRWQVWLVVAGFPAVYWLNSFTPWSMGSSSMATGVGGALSSPRSSCCTGRRSQLSL
ncbi:MAG TPA: hypothetical protein VGN57_16560 [Pirellulaceae bacterium]|nr:hypothetical protein [Pirellulaceae bacterium]